MSPKRVDDKFRRKIFKESGRKEKMYFCSKVNGD
jgi:hypothetical protein